jgi:endonuclease III
MPGTVKIRIIDEHAKRIVGRSKLCISNSRGSIKMKITELSAEQGWQTHVSLVKASRCVCTVICLASKLIYQ